MEVSNKEQNDDQLLVEPPLNDKQFKRTYTWLNIVIIGSLQLLSLYGIWLIITFQVQWKTILFNAIYTVFVITSVTAGAHRLWSHKAFKAKMPFRIWLALGHAAAFQKTLYQWVRDHRVHHMYTDTDADPHNSLNGFFFSHMGWLFVSKHPEVLKKGKDIDMTDLLSDPVVRFQKKYYYWLVLSLTFLLPTYVPMYLWGETFTSSFFACLARLGLNLQFVCFVNSVGHMYGLRPYDVNIRPVDNKIISMLTMGEGWHNYHHVFPWDYKTGELGTHIYDLSTGLINLMEYIGQAYDLKTASKELVRSRVMRTGEENIWKYYSRNY